MRDLSTVEANPWHEQGRPVVLPRRKYKPKRPALFNAWWRDLATGARTRATRDELREAYRLYAVHRDIREQRA